MKKVLALFLLALFCIPSSILTTFFTPLRNSPYYGDVPVNHEIQHTQLNYDPAPLIDYLRNTPRDQWDGNDMLRLFTDDFFSQDQQIVISNFPRIAFLYDAETGTFSGFSTEGILHLGFDYNKDSELFYATKNPWMRMMGYSEFYDWLGGALTAFTLDTRRIRFEYNNLDYQVQLWKGQYWFGAVMGSEIGFYTKPKSRLAEHYDCYPLDQMMPISMKLYSDQAEYFDLPPEEHWWAVMMRYRQPRVDPDQVTLEGTIDFTRDPGLKDAFFAAIQTQYPEIEVSLDGNLLWLRWNAERSALPPAESNQPGETEQQTETVLQTAEPVSEVSTDLFSERFAPDPSTP
ncbi:MAG: DUF4474 domain-containing protein [Oscillospiraceae bacterium]|jgi:hypothetical protein|nr:DUF4474 domain-containing protein [Oscillospiraceae bacterium]